MRDLDMFLCFIVWFLMAFLVGLQMNIIDDLESMQESIVRLSATLDEVSQILEGEK
jgi:hypothetical protein